VKLTHIRLLVTEFDACVRFYRDILGLEAIWGEEGSGYASFRAGDGSLLALFGREAMAAAIDNHEAPVRAAGQDRAMLIFEAADLAGTFAALKAKRVTFLSEIEDQPEWGIRTAFLRDPEGTLIELNCPLPKEYWSASLREADGRYPGEG
jgi:catechol 2,3-dioxygenase-like lactoylglutathione lyase family enzyme